MAGVDDVLERLFSDAGFARQLAQDPASALAGYELSEDDLDLLSAQVLIDTSIGDPNHTPGGTRGIIIDTSIGDPNLTPDGGAHVGG
jgi:hypothetical protein